MEDKTKSDMFYKFVVILIFIAIGLTIGEKSFQVYDRLTTRKPTAYSMVDKDTGVNYIVYRYANRLAITERLDPSGNVIVGQTIDE